MAQFLELFHRYGYIYKEDENWLSANERWRLGDSTILKAISGAGRDIIGTRAGRTTRYAVLDIDASSRYHNQEELVRLLSVLAHAGLTRSSLYRSSFSGGWHLYIFFEEAVNSARLYQLLIKLLKRSDFVIAKGTLEVFPNPGYASLGMGLRLPLQAGWAWLDKRTLEIDYERFEMSATKALEIFLDALDADANSVEDFQSLAAHVQRIESELASGAIKSAGNIVPLRKAAKTAPSSELELLVASIFGHLPLNVNAETWSRGRTFHMQGLTASSQRAEALFCLGHYFFYGDPSRNLPSLGYGCAEERKSAVEQFLCDHHNGYSKDLTRGQKDATAQIERAANWLPVHKRNEEIQQYVLEQPLAWKKENERRKADARRRIQDGLAALKQRRRPFSTVELQEAAGCGRQTLYKHTDLWQQDYEDLANGFFAACTDEYNAVNCSESAAPILEPVPMGLVVAKQVAFEIRLSIQKDLQSKQRSKEKPSTDRESSWRAKVATVTRPSPSGLSVNDLKARLFVLRNFLSLAPFEEDAAMLLPFVQQLRKELAMRTGPPYPIPE